MKRIDQELKKRRAIAEVQSGRCLLCNFPSRLGLHLHHIIARDDGGPDDLLNLVGLCPNHHRLVETVRRHIAPPDTSRNVEWLAKAQAAKDHLAALSEPERAVFDALAAPHPFRQEIHVGVPSDLRKHFAQDLALADAVMLTKVYQAHDRLHGASQEGGGTTLSANDFAGVIANHLTALNLPYDHRWLQAPAELRRYSASFSRWSSSSSSRR